MKFGSEDLSKYAWDRDEVGIWYGGWSAKNWSNSLIEQNQFEYLRNLPQPELRRNFRKVDLDTAKRFANIQENDWIVVFFDNSFHLAQVCGSLKSDDRLMNRNGEIFKYRKIVAKKSFSLARLPDSYRLIPSAGRANVHKFGETSRELIKLLVENKNEESVIRTIRKMPFIQWLDILGPAGWESFCLGYLIKKEGFMPTGLGVGRTLPTFDIVGRSKNGIRVVAQCKKNHGSIRISEEFIDACNGMNENTLIYFFAYGGIIRKNPKQVKIVSRDDIEQWVKTMAGRNYADMWHKAD